MAIHKNKIRLKYKFRPLWLTDMEPVEIVINKRKYRLIRNQKAIRIDRRINDWFDTMGFIPFKTLAVAKGTVEKVEGQTIVNLKVSLKSAYKYALIIFASIFGLVCIWLMFENFVDGLILTCLVALFIGLKYLMLNHGKNAFKRDLENDINYF